MRFVLPTLFHLIPLAPLVNGRPYGTIAAVLFVALPYIKVFKLRQDLGEAKSERERQGLKAAISRWRAFTFLPVAAESPPPPPGTP